LRQLTPSRLDFLFDDFGDFLRAQAADLFNRFHL